MIQLKNVFLKRKETQVLENFSWDVKRDEHWFIMGNNGCGKTSLYEVVMGYLWPQKGTVSVFGETFGHVFIPDIRKRIGYVSPWIFKRMHDSTSVPKVVASGTDGSVGFWGDIPADLMARVREKLAFFHCEDLENRNFGALSSGQQFKVMLARATINNPELILLDEPFAQLDIGARMEAYDFMRQLSESHSVGSIVLVTHHLEDISEFYTHGLLFAKDNVCLKGTKEEILKEEVFQKTFNAQNRQVKFFTE